MVCAAESRSVAVFSNDPMQPCSGLRVTFQKRKHFLEALAYQCKGREVFLRRGSVPSKRPLKAEDSGELRRLIDDFPGSETLSVYASVERFSDSLRLGVEKPEALRIGWDLFVDVDAGNLDDAKVCTASVVKVLKHFELESFRVKFSGRRGFHVTVPGEAFDCFLSTEEFLAAFPTVPLRLSQFLKACLKPDQRRGVEIDGEVYKPRQMARLAYSLHSSTGLVSIPLNHKDVKSFKLEDARPEKVEQIDWDWLRLQPRYGEAFELLKAVAEWSQQHKPRQAVKILSREKASETKSGYRWVERLLSSPVEDGRHRILWLIVTPYLVNIKGLSVDEAKVVALDYLKKCSERRRIKDNQQRLASYYVAYAKRTGLKPLSVETLRQKHPDLYEIVKAS